MRSGSQFPPISAEISRVKVQSTVPLPSKSGRGHEGVAKEKKKKMDPHRSSLSLERWSWLIHDQASTYVTFSLTFRCSLSLSLLKYLHSENGWIDIPLAVWSIYNVVCEKLFHFFSRSKKPFAAHVPGAPCSLGRTNVGGTSSVELISFFPSGSICLTRTDERRTKKDDKKENTDWNIKKKKRKQKTTYLNLKEKKDANRLQE